MTKHTKAYIALVFICIVWGTTYLAMKIGMKHYPAFLFAGVRQSVAGILLMTVALSLNKRKDLSARNVARQMLVGFLMLTIGNGFVSLGIKFIPSGISALICSMMPIFAVLFNLASSKKDHFNASIGFGLLLGTCGVGLIFRHHTEGVANPHYLAGVLSTLLATGGWALGSVVNKRQTDAVNPFLNSGMQLFFGGLFMLLISPVADTYAGFIWWDTKAILALIYLIIFGSALAYTAYMYALSTLPVGIATMYAYINPLIAVLAGYLFLEEQLNIYTGMAFITIIISVYLMNKGYRKQHRAEMKTAENLAAAFPESISIE